jgi:hypothetical protein
LVTWEYVQVEAREMFVEIERKDLPKDLVADMGL